MALIANEPWDPPMMKTSGRSVGKPNRDLAALRAFAQLGAEATQALATSERSGKPANSASENFP